MPRIEIACGYCGVAVLKWPSQLRSSVYCSHACRGRGWTGSNNPNYAKRWSAAQKEKQSLLTSRQMTPERRTRIGDQHRGKIMSDSTRAKMAARTDNSRPHSESSKIKIGISSSAKFTAQYKKEERKRKEAQGLYVPLEKKSDWDLYRTLSNWVMPMFDLVVDAAQLEKLRIFGVFDPLSNSSGVVRDHMLGRYQGFVLGVYPEILRHPCNLQLLTNAENLSKSKKISVLGARDCSLSVASLVERIYAYKGVWKEHGKCLKLLGLYASGGRYSRDSYVSCWFGEPDA